MQKNRKKVLLTKEFGSELNKACPIIREVALSSAYKLDEVAGQILFGAIVRQHQEKVIKPKLRSGKYDIILSDRGPDSNFAYAPNHITDPHDSEMIAHFFRELYHAAELPSITFFLDITPSLSAKRRKKRDPEKFKNKGVDRVEKKGTPFMTRVRKSFLALAKKNPDRIVVIKVTPKKKATQVLKEGISILKRRKII